MAEEATAPSEQAAQETGGAAPTLAEVTATLTAPGQMFEMETLTIRSVPTRTWKTAPATLRSVLELSALHGDKDFLVYEDERISFSEHFQQVAALSPGPRRPVRDRQGRPGGHRHAQPARVGHRLLGGDRRRSGGRPPQRLVDRGRARLRTLRLGHLGGVRGRGAKRADPPRAGRGPGAPDHGGLPTRSPTRTAAGGRRARDEAERPGRAPLPVVPFADAVGDLPGDGHRSPTSRSSPTTTPPSSTPRAPPAGPRAPSAPTATASRT